MKWVLRLYWYPYWFENIPYTYKDLLFLLLYSFLSESESLGGGLWVVDVGDR